MIRYEQVIAAIQQSIFPRVLISVTAAGCRDNRSGVEREIETETERDRQTRGGRGKCGVKIEI
jgi:hypothetical protein